MKLWPQSYLLNLYSVNDKNKIVFHLINKIGLIHLNIQCSELYKFGTKLLSILDYHPPSLKCKIVLFLHCSDNKGHAKYDFTELFNYAC